ncbi:sensor histidine kinase [Nocardia panacis]|uniref:histidine kinase n=1 Tax=Nocardia panacis TaxID=2340916 RepID=A0A3A4KB97_9NOCA|nr:HAMP domain-containing sensor histidine kinase [Nocardia panacis]RJO69888.1 sensor histidine kinase [Nocardia panacis]
MSRSPSLRTRVALVSGAVAALVALTLGISYTALLGAAGARQLDDTLHSIDVAVVRPPGAPQSFAPANPPHAPAQADSAPSPGIRANTAPAPANSAPHDETLASVEGLPGITVALSPDRDRVATAVQRSQLLGVAIGVAGVLLAAVLGWLLAGYAARPLRRLATATHGIETLDALPPLSGRGAREAEELSDAITRMLTRLEAAHTATTNALAGARDFAAVCAHELRTPLTSLRTDLQVLATKDIPADQHAAILADVLLTERRIETTLTDLERLAIGELTESDAYEPFDLCETLDRAVHDARRRHPDTRIEFAACTPTTVTGIPGGIMLIAANAIANAVQHGRADTVIVSAAATPDAVDIRIDDNGSGIPLPLRTKAFDRFIKGPGSPGSGLGLALIRQQAELHGGAAELTESPLGGTRLNLRIPLHPDLSQPNP